MSFKVIDGDGPGKEEGDREREREWAQGEFSYAIRDCAANMLRIVRGAGKSYEILHQMQTVIEAAVKFQKAHGHWPSSDSIQRELALHDDYEQQLERQQEGKLSQETIDRWREDGMFDRMYAKHVMCKGALQIAASGLIGQDTQQRAGESELQQGIRLLEDAREKQARQLRAAARAKPKAAKRKSRKPSGPEVL
jgi:hypothetical protein